jgi:hypothetical protein
MKRGHIQDKHKAVSPPGDETKNITQRQLKVYASALKKIIKN